MGTGYHVDDVQTIQKVESQMMMSWGSHTKQLHKMIAQDKMMSCPRKEMMNNTFRMLQSNSGVYGGPETG